MSRSADGAASFSKVGPKNVAFADVELASDGTGLALAIPEALWLTVTRAPPGRRLPGKTHGSARALAQPQRSRAASTPCSGPYHFVDQPPRIEAGSPSPATARSSRRTPPRGPDAAALADGRAIMRRHALPRSVGRARAPERLRAVPGPLDGKLEPTPVPELKGCRSARLAGFDQILELACFRGPTDAGSVPVKFFRSDSAGAHFEPEPFTAFGNRETFASRWAQAAA